MKMTSEHYNYVKSCMETLKDKIQKHREYIKNNEYPNDLEMRLRWDIFIASVPIDFVSKNLYSYLNDTHIDTALRKIIQEIERR